MVTIFNATVGFRYLSCIYPALRPCTTICTPLRNGIAPLKVHRAYLTTSNGPRFVPPLPAITLGASGLIPFLAPPLYMMYNNGLFCTDGEFMHLVYSASILSFLGGVRWGITLPDGSSQKPDWKNLTYSVTPSLLAWVGVLAGSPLGYIPITTGLVACCVIDVKWPGYPFWFKVLRVLLTSGALLSTFLLFKVKHDQDKSFGVVESIDGFKRKYYAWKNDSS